MKYVRTKDGIYELKVNEELKAQKTSNYFYIQHKGYGCNLLYDKQDLKKFEQADTIEELCDFFMKEDELDNVMNATIKFSPAIFASRTYVQLMAKKEHLTFIGYIVVERKGVKTLEPVARIDKKGKAKLL